jgi:hypothetical protein
MVRVGSFFLFHFCLVASSYGEEYTVPEQYWQKLPLDEDQKVQVTSRQDAQTAAITLTNNSSYRLLYAYVGCNVSDSLAMKGVGVGGYFKDVFRTSKKVLHIDSGSSATVNINTGAFRVTECSTGTLEGQPQKVKVQSFDSQCRGAIYRLLDRPIPWDAEVSKLGKGTYVAEFVDSGRVVRRRLKCISTLTEVQAGFDD